MKRLFCLILAFCLLFLIAGCGSSTQSSTNKQPKIDSEATAQLKTFLSENYGGSNPTTWYPLIKDVKVINGEMKYAEIETTIFNDEEGKKVGQSIANIIKANSPAKLDYVLIKDKDGWILAKSS